MLNTVCVPGIIVSEVRFDPTVPPPVTVTVAVLDLTPPNPFMLAVMVTLPGATAVARPEELTVATAALLELHATWLVMSLVDGGWLPWT